MNESFAQTGTSPLMMRLKDTDWFSHVGEQLDSGKYRLVGGWEEGFAFVNHEVRLWCTVEARNSLYSQLSTQHYDRFRHWNEIARQLADRVTALVQQALATPGVPEFPDSAQKWLQGLLVGAFMEEAYDDCVRVTLFRELAHLLDAGHFPCGWYCRSADDFPDHSPIIVY